MTARVPARVSVRPAGPSDHAAIAALFESSYALLMRDAYEPDLLAAALPLITRANPMLLASGTFFVATGTGGAVLGCGGWTHARPGSGRLERGLGHIRHFATHPDSTGQGIGRRLYLSCEEQASEAGIERFECYASLNAEGFYAALGFEKRDDITVTIGHDIDFPAVLMTRELPPRGDGVPGRAASGGG